MSTAGERLSCERQEMEGLRILARMIARAYQQDRGDCVETERGNTKISLPRQRGSDDGEQCPH
jgi:hypothetical protein